MRLLTRSLFFIMLVLSLAGCKRGLNPETIPSHIVVGDTYFTQFVIRYEKNTHVTTNYRRGASIPVNTQVKLVEITGRTISMELKQSGQKILIKNIEKHTGMDILNTFDRYLARSPVRLSRFSRTERKNIQNGTVAKGMRKNAVTTAIGFPPSTETHSLDANTWVYWSHRYNRFNVNFNRDRVTSVVD